MTARSARLASWAVHLLLMAGLLLIAGYWIDLVPQGRLIEIQTSLACPVMVAVMLARFRLYAGHASHRRHTPPT